MRVRQGTDKLVDIVACHPQSGRVRGSSLHLDQGSEQLGFYSTQVDVVIIAQFVTGPGQIHKTLGVIPFSHRKRLDKPLRQDLSSSVPALAASARNLGQFLKKGCLFIRGDR